jgi:DNA-binding SARP family transcriptional activator/TolB-like protein/Flp pilus assembly protein TadD
VSMPESRLTLLGAFALSGTAPCAMVSKKAQALLAFLAMPAGQPHRRDKLAAMLWADRSEESARQNLRQCLTAIRRAWEGAGSFPLVTEGDVLRLAPASLTIDACEFEQALRTRRPQDLERAFSLYRGDLLEGLNLQGQPFEEWLIGERRRLRSLAMEGLGQLLHLQEQSGAREQATQTAIRLLTIDELQEPVHRTLMRLYHETGNTAQALRQYGICEKTLRRELSVEPDAETKKLRREILRSRSTAPVRSHSDQTKATQRCKRTDLLREGTSMPEASRDGGSSPGAELSASGAARSSLAVLPFENLSEDAALTLLADGLVEDVITLLARIPGFFVIARRSSFFYRNRLDDLRRVGRELGISYVVAGSVRSSREQLRIVVNLFEVDSGMQHWARQYDVEHGDALEIQGKIAGDIMVELQPQLTRAELTKIRRQRPDNLGAWAHYHEAVGGITLEGFTEQSLRSAIDHLHQATVVDKNFALAYSLLALWTTNGANLSFLPHTAVQYSQAREAAEKAIALDPNGPEVIGYAGCALVAMGDISRGRELVERAVELDPSNPQARVSLGATQVRAGEFERGIENMRLGIRSSPRDYGLTWWSMRLANALRLAGRLEEALTQIQTVCRRDGRLHMARVVMASTLTALGRPEEARHAILDARRIRPTLTLSEVARFVGNSVAAELQAVWP